MTIEIHAENYGICAGCGVPFDVFGEGTINLTPDFMLYEHEETHWPEPAVEGDTAFDWCRGICFFVWFHRAVEELGQPPLWDETNLPRARWLYKAAVQLGSHPRPRE